MREVAICVGVGSAATAALPAWERFPVVPRGFHNFFLFEYEMSFTVVSMTIIILSHVSWQYDMVLYFFWCLYDHLYGNEILFFSCFFFDSIRTLLLVYLSRPQNPNMLPFQLFIFVLEVCDSLSLLH